MLWRSYRPTEKPWAQWVSDGYTLAEASAVRMLKENNTKPCSADKRETALGWIRAQSEKSGLEWDGALAAKLLELHHAKLTKAARQT